MSLADLLTRARRQGLSFELPNGRLKIRGSRKAVEPGFLKEIDGHKEEIIERLEASCAWQRAVEEIAAKWNEYKARHGDAPWLTEEDDDGLQREVGEAIRAGDLDQALQTIERWKQAWQRLLGGD